MKPLQRRPSVWATSLRSILSIASLLLVGAGASAQALADRSLTVVDLRVPGQADSQRLYDKSYALVIGVSNYTAGWRGLPGVRGDVPAVVKLLTRHGFTVEKTEDPDYATLDRVLREFIARYGSEPRNRLLVYFAGHGHTIKKDTGVETGYLVPKDAPHPGSDPVGFESKAYNMDTIEALSRQANTRHLLFMFDSCFAGSIFVGRDSQTPDHISHLSSQPVRLFITAGNATQKVPDQSVFRDRLERGLGEGDADINGDGYITGTELGVYLHQQVSNASRQSQTPQWGKIRDARLDRGDFVFMSPRGSRTADGADVARERDAWDLCKTGRTGIPCEVYLSEFPNGRFANLARGRVRDFQASVPESVPQPRPPALANPTASTATNSIQTFAANGVSFKMVTIPSGSFLMGSPDSESGRSGDEGPQRSVSLNRFQLGQTEVTQGLWRAVMGSNASIFFECGDDCPVENVSWEAAQTFIQKLNHMTGQRFRLPSEAEWEYAARAGCDLPFNVAGQCRSKIEATEAVYKGNETYNGSSPGEFRFRKLKVASFAANNFGLYDMHGNVMEWVQDCFVQNYVNSLADGSAVDSPICWRRVLRGGGWGDHPRKLRTAARVNQSPVWKNSSIGFRLARTF